MLPRALHALILRTYSRYIGASALALAVDFSLFLALLKGGLHPGMASATGYGAGIVAHWMISSRFVFDDALAQDANGLTRQKGLFVMSALIGLAMTTAIVSAGHWLGVDPRLAKLAAIALSFNVTYLLRKTVVFAK